MTEKNFAAALAGLEEAVQRLESGELSLEESLGVYEQGVRCAALCRKRLESAETRVQILQEKNGRLVSEETDAL